MGQFPDSQCREAEFTVTEGILHVGDELFRCFWLLNCFRHADSTIAMARNMARALFIVSSHSKRGMESATTPAPA